MEKSDSFTKSLLLFSKHVVCERLSAMHYHIPATRMFGSKFLECPHSSIWEMWSGVPPTLQPLKMKIWSGAGTWDLNWSGVNPPPPYEHLVRTWHLGLRCPPKDLCGSWCVETDRYIPKNTVSFWNSCKINGQSLRNGKIHLEAQKRSSLIFNVFCKVAAHIL